MTSDLYEEIRRLLSWEQVAAEIGAVIKSHKIPSPFKTEATPSCHLYPDGTFHCFASHVSGDVTTLLAHHYGKGNYAMAVELAQRLNIPVELPEQSQGKKLLYSHLEEATKWYQGNLKSAAAQLYLRKRGISPETAKAWCLGFVTAEGGVLDHLMSLGATREELEAGGFISSRGNELFRNRFMFPLQDKQGRVVGFAGRAMTDEQMPKYLNSPTTKTFYKKRYIYGLAHQSKADYLILVEGYMDVLSLWQAGHKNVGGVMGTALTQEQLDLLGDQKLILLLDADAAGQEATKRALLSLKYSSDTLIATLPVGKDPDEFIRSGGAFDDLATTPVHQWLIDAVQVPAAPREREKVARNLLGFVTNTGSPTLDKINKDYLQARFQVAALPAPVASQQTAMTNAKLALQKWAAAYLISYPFAICYVNRYFDRLGLDALATDDFTLPEYELLVEGLQKYIYAPDITQVDSWLISKAPALEGALRKLQDIAPDRQDIVRFLELRLDTFLREGREVELVSLMTKLIQNPPPPDAYPSPS